MHMSLSRRTQILLDEDRYRRLEREAGGRGASIAELIREAIDLAYPATSAERCRAASEFLREAERDPLPALEPAELKEAILSGLEKDRSG